MVEKISIPPASAVEITSKLTASPGVSLIGLGARDSLRLEAGMCLYGHDLDESVSPIEAGLAWLVGKSSFHARPRSGLRAHPEIWCFGNQQARIEEPLRISLERPGFSES